MTTTPWIFIGCYTRKTNGGKGIYTCTLDAKTGALTLANIFTAIEDPSFLCLSHDNKTLYAAIETDDFNQERSGGVAAFRVDQKTGELTLLNQHLSGAAEPCHISIDKTNNCMLVSNYSVNYNGGGVAVFLLNADGSIRERSQLIQYSGVGPFPNRQNYPHAHSAIISPNNQQVFVQDFSGDCIHQYFLDPIRGKLTENNPAVIHMKPGTGPRHFIFHPHKPYAYLVGELNNTVAVFDYAAQSGQLTEKQIMNTLPADFHGADIAADIHFTHDGRFLYVSNRGHDSIAMFSVDQNTGKLTSLGHQSTLGQHPRNFFISSDDRLLLCANQDTDNVVSFYIDANTGLLTPTGEQSHFGKPVCVEG